MKPRFLLVLALGALLLLGLTAAAFVQVTGYAPAWWTVDGGGGVSSASGYHLSGTIGQPETGLTLSGGNYRVEGGFWSGGGSGAPLGQLYLPLVYKP